MRDANSANLRWAAAHVTGGRASLLKCRKEKPWCSAEISRLARCAKAARPRYPATASREVSAETHQWMGHIEVFLNTFRSRRHQVESPISMGIGESVMSFGRSFCLLKSGTGKAFVH
jgi:hypothetical protein